MPLPDGYVLQADADPVAAHAFLTNSYWAKGIALDTVRLAFANSLTVSIRHNEGQVAAARVISDMATFAYLNDVYVLDAHRGKGLCGAMLRWLLDHPQLQGPDSKGIARWALFTKDKQAVYARYGWREYPWPERMMIIDAKVFPQ